VQAAGGETLTGRRQLGLLLGIAVFVLVADIVSKAIVTAHIRLGADIHLIGSVLMLTQVRNGGAAFNIGGTSMTIVFTLIAAGVVIYILRTARKLYSIGWAVALGLLLGGATGNLVETTSDLTVAGRGRFLQMLRTYNSQAAASEANPDAAGFGWAHTYSESLSFDASGNAIVRQDNGSTVSFFLSGGIFTPPAFVIATLVKNSNGTYTFTLPDQRADIFSSLGVLLVQTDRNGYQTSMTYDGAGHLTSVTDPSSRKLPAVDGASLDAATRYICSLEIIKVQLQIWMVKKEEMAAQPGGSRCFAA